MGSGRAEQVVVLGCGGIGLPLAVALASRGRRVLGVDVDPERVEALADGRLAVEDAGLQAALRRALAAAAITFSTTLAPSPGGRAYVIATPTPVDEASRFDP